MYLKQSTASQSVLIGPFVDSTDGVTAETGLTIANTDIRLSANGGNMAAKTSGGGTHDEAGWYTITLDATDTATVGRLQLSVAVAGALPVWAEFQVLEENVYDAWLGASAAAGTDLAAILTDTADMQPKLGTPAGADMSADIAAVKSDSAAILTDTGTDGVVVAAASKSDYRLSSTGVDDILDEVTEGTTTLRQLMRGFAAVLLGKASGLDTTSAVYRDIGDSKDRITATVDADGNRSAVTRDLT